MGAVLEVRELPARPMQQMVLMEPAAVAEEVLERDGLSAPARISPAVMAVKVAMDMWRWGRLRIEAAEIKKANLNRGY